MKKVFLFTLAIIVGCSHLKNVKVDYLYPIKPETAQMVIESVKQTPTFIALSERAKRPLIEVEEELDGWVWVNIYSVGRDFGSRWATFRIDGKSGKTLRRETAENLEDKWIIEYDPSRN